MTLHEKALKITTIVMDVDGVLTDGSIGYGGDGREIKFFNVRDGHAIKLASRGGMAVGILSGRASEANRTRARELSFDFAVENCKNKAEGFEKLLHDRGITAEQCMYIGDDLVDLPPMRKAGVGVAVGDGVTELDTAASFRTKAFGGRGAVREAIEWLLKEQGKWEELVKRYF